VMEQYVAQTLACKSYALVVCALDVHVHGTVVGQSSANSRPMIMRSMFNLRQTETHLHSGVPTTLSFIFSKLVFMFTMLTLGK
jgi:hypothetical protein